MNLTSFLYAELNIFSILLLILILSNHHRNRAATLDNKLFNSILISVIAVLFFDTAMWLLDGKQFTFSKDLYEIAC